MSRGIKFRAKDTSGNWIVGGFFEKRQPCGRIDSIIHDGRHEHVVIRATLNQYTGINDKNGIEICEGDEFIDEEHQHGKVFFDNKKACFMVAIQEYTYDEHGSTITYTAPLFEALDCGAEISVIIKNPELLEDK